MPEPIRTARLDLVPARPRHLAAELDGSEALAATLGVRVPDGWPPDLYDRDAIEFFLVVAQHTPAQDAHWLSYYFVLRDDEGFGPVVVGTGGYKGPPEAGEVEVGYSVLDVYRRRGIASEAVAELAASLGVLARCGFRPLGPGIDEGAIRFAIERRDWRVPPGFAAPEVTT
jgi:RimJ/RimL family protein N-acetyltransferase